MRLKDVLLIARAGEPCEPQFALAASLAQEFGALIDGVCVYSEPELPTADSYAIGAAAVTDVLAHREHEIQRLVGPTEAAYRATIADRGLSRSWSTGEAEEWTWALIRQARFADLVIIGLPGADSIAHRLAESMAISTGAPCLLVPCSSTTKVFERVVLAWDGSREAKQAMDDGLVFMAAASAVCVVIAHEDGDAVFYEAHGGRLLTHLARHGVHAELKVVSRPSEKIGDLILAECLAFRADLLIMGAYGHARAREMMLGGATRTMLGHARQPVLMSH